MTTPVEAARAGRRRHSGAAAIRRAHSTPDPDTPPPETEPVPDEEPEPTPPPVREPEPLPHQEPIRARRR